MFNRVTSIVFCVLAVVASNAALADYSPKFVIPGKRGVPVIINGYDASYAYVEGDWGLSRPGFVPQVVIGGRYVGPRYERGPRNHYYPSTGKAPLQGRHEVDTPEDRKTEAESFSRSWESRPANQPVPPADLPQPPIEGMQNLPPVIIAPQIGPHHPKP